jgi:hypothetical protein
MASVGRAVGDPEGDSSSEHSGLARPGRGHDADRPGRRNHRFPLAGSQVPQQAIALHPDDDTKGV